MKITDEVKVTKDRIAVVIGKNGVTKKQIEKKTGTKIEVNTDLCVVKIEREISKAPGISIYAKNVVKAIAGGFTPKQSMKLLKDNYYFDSIDLKEHVKEKQLKRIKARLIGTEGKTRKRISAVTKTDIVIYKNTLNIIGTTENSDRAFNALLMLVKGASHRTVFNYLSRSQSK